MSELSDFVNACLSQIDKEKPVLRPVNPVRLGQFHDDDYWYLLNPIRWEPNADTPSKYKSVEVPLGFVTDLTSTPRALWTMLPRTGVYLHAAIVHDYLYWIQHTSREDADDILHYAMTDLKVGLVARNAIYKGVQLGGNGAWKSNAALKAKGEKRILKLLPSDPMTTWQEWKSQPGVFV